MKLLLSRRSAIRELVSEGGNTAEEEYLFLSKVVQCHLANVLENRLHNAWCNASLCCQAFKIPRLCVVLGPRGTGPMVLS
jgi:hypothetical protein